MNIKALHASSLRAAVVAPPIEDFYLTRHRMSALGAKILCNILSENGLQVSFHNFPLERKTGQVIEIPDQLKYLSDFIMPHETGRLSYFTKYQRFGPNYQQCAQQIVSSIPTLCFISCFAFAYSMQAIELARSIKRLQPGLPIIIGGAGPSANPLFFIKELSIDFVITGEAEVSVKYFLCSFINQAISLEQVPNLYWKETNPIRLDKSLYAGSIYAKSVDTSAIVTDQIKKSNLTIWTKDIDISVIFSKSYTLKNRIVFSTSLSRGCSKQCRFCSQFLAHGNRFRTASMKTVKKAIERLPHPDEFQDCSLTINIEDDNILLNQTYFKQVIEILKDRYPMFSMMAENGIDYTLLTPFLVNELIASGMAQFNISIAACNEIIAKKEKRNLEIELYQSIIQAIAQHSLPVITYFVCGFEDDTKESIVDTLAFLATQPTIIGISLYYAVPGIGNFEDVRAFDDLPPYLCCGSSAYPWNRSLSTQTMITAFRLSRYCNLLKQAKLSDMEKRMIGKIQSEKKLYTFVKAKSGVEIAAAPGQDEELVKLFFRMVMQK